MKNISGATCKENPSKINQKDTNYETRDPGRAKLTNLEITLGHSGQHAKENLQRQNDTDYEPQIKHDQT